MITIPSFIDACYKAIKKKNPDFSDEKIYAICWSQYNKKKKKSGGEEDIIWEDTDLSDAEYEIYRERFVKLVEEIEEEEEQ